MTATLLKSGRLSQFVIPTPRPRRSEAASETRIGQSNAGLTSPRYPHRTVECGLRALLEQRLVGSDRLLRRLAPAEGLRALEAGAPPTLRLADHVRRGAAERFGIPILHEYTSPADNLDHARVPKHRHGAAPLHAALR